VYLPLACRIVIASTFALSIVVKLRVPGSFTALIGTIQKLPHPSFTSPLLLGRAIVGGESLVLVLVIIPLTATAGLLLAGVAFVTYLVVTMTAIWRHLRVECNCFGASGEVMGIPGLVRNAGLLVVALVGAVLTYHPAESLTGNVLLDTVMSAFGAMAVTTMAVYADDFAWLWSRPSRHRTHLTGPIEPPKVSSGWVVTSKDRQPG